jgi:hypothetical protein
MLIIKELLFDKTKDEYVAERLTRCPADVELDTVKSWLEQQYGAPTNVADSVDPEVGKIQVGWVYEVPSDWPSANPTTQELVAMPMGVDDAGKPGDSAFLVQAQIRRAWRATAEREGFELKVITLEHRPYEAKGESQPPNGD